MAYQVGKRGQVAVWAIFAVAIVALVALLLFVKRDVRPEAQEIETPGPYIEKCTREAVIEISEKMMEQGGFVEPRNYKRFDGINITYMCENIGNFEPCINQHPVLISEIKEEI